PNHAKLSSRNTISLAVARAEPMADPQIRLNINRVILFEADMDRAQRAGDNGGTGFVERHPGPSAPLGEGAGDDHAARCHLEDPGAEAEMGAHPGIVWRPSSRRRAAYSAKGVSGSRWLSVGRSGA